jgi:hypothetical protein
MAMRLPGASHAVLRAAPSAAPPRVEPHKTHKEHEGVAVLAGRDIR